MNISQRKFAERYDKERALNDYHQSVFDSMLTGSGWTENDGPIPGVFASRPAGHRCLWSCRWATESMHLLEPNNWCPVESMRIEALQTELGDILFASGDSMAAAAGRLLHEWNAGSGGPEHWTKRTRDLIQSARQLYGEYTCLWDLPGRNLRRVSIRPGWSEQTARQIAEQWHKSGGRNG